MASVISTKRKGTKVILELACEYDEFLQLKGHLDDIHLFTEKTAVIRTNISQRGRNEATKYFLIPREFRKGFLFENVTSCQRLDIPEKVIFIYVVDRYSKNPSKREIVLKNIEKRVTSSTKAAKDYPLVYRQDIL